MDFTGKLKDITVDFISGKLNMVFQINEKDFESTEIQGELLDIKAVVHRDKRSHDANAYCWVLISKIANVLQSSKDEVYEHMLHEYGFPFLDDDGNAEKISLLKTIDVGKFGLHVKYIGASTVQGKEFNHYIVIKGSSEYDTKEMSDFIDRIVQEAQALGIQTVSTEEIRKMKERWGV